MDDLRKVVVSMSRVEAAYIYQKAHSTGKAVVCVCAHTMAEKYASALNAQGIVTELDSSVDTESEQPQPGLYQVRPENNASVFKTK